MDNYDIFFKIGIIVKPQGIKGELRVFPTTDDPERFSLLKSVFIFQKNHIEYTVQWARVQKAMVILKLAGVNDRDAAEALTNAVIKIPPGMALPLEDNEYYQRDLIGMDVFTDEGELLGKLTDVLRTGANDVYAVNKPGEKEILIPAIKNCVLNVDVAGKKMTVRLMDGLRE